MNFPRKIYCIGIGGIGLSALAQYLKALGHDVTGSDREASRVTELLESKGIRVAVPQDAKNIQEGMGLVIYSAAVPEDNPERIRARELGIPQMNYFEALGKATEGKRVVAVAGTHGKTTTTAMIAKILADAEHSPSAIVGSIVTDFGSNFLEGSSDIVVVEACEYKRHFLQLAPEVLVITNIELDHTDYYKDLDDLIAGFRSLAQKARVVVADSSNPSVAKALAGLSAVVEYSGAQAPELQLIGEFNRMNARAAKSAVRALDPDLTEEEIDASLKAFKGTWRRFEYKGTTASGALVFDDYAHHPTAIRKTLEGARGKFPGKKIIVAFHPHLYSRTKDLFEGFTEELAKADAVVLAPIYPAREVDTGEVSSELLAEAIRSTNPNAQAVGGFKEVERYLDESGGEGDIIITMGAGDIYKVADKLVHP